MHGLFDQEREKLVSRWTLGNREAHELALVDRDKMVKSLLDQGMGCPEIQRKLALGKTSVQQSMQRVKTTHKVTFKNKILRFQSWLFDASNAHEDPCLKWLEIFGEIS
jgi:hypothetical protein